MALINCPECNKEVSNTATMCPHCGFGVAKYIKETERKQREVANQQRMEMLLEQKQAEREKQRERRIAVEQTRISQLKKIKAFWILLALIPYSIIAGILADVRDYIVLKQNGVQAVETENVLSWLINNDSISSVLGIFVVLIIPSILYIISKNIKNNKTTKILLVVGLVYHIVWLLLMIIGHFTTLMVWVTNPNLNFGMAQIDRSLIAIITRTIIPICAYILLFYKATRLKK